MNRKLTPILCVAALTLAVCLSATQARAITIDFDSGTNDITQIDGIKVSGTTYDVTFLVYSSYSTANLGTPTAFDTNDATTLADDLDVTAGTQYDGVETSGGFITTGTGLFTILNPNSQNTSYWTFESPSWTNESKWVVLSGNLSPGDPPPVYGQAKPLLASFSAQTPVPEPGTALLLGFGLIFLAGLLRKSKRQFHVV